MKNLNESGAASVKHVPGPWVYGIKDLNMDDDNSWTTMMTETIYFPHQLWRLIYFVGTIYRWRQFAPEYLAGGHRVVKKGSYAERF